MGVAVFAGMIGVTLFSIFLTPVFCVLLRQMTGDRPLSDLVLSFEPPAHSIVQ
jgi:multidrug efflux pump